MAKIKTSSAKAKGRDLQDKVAELVIAAYNNIGFPIARNEDLRTAIMGEKGDDVQTLSSWAKWLWPFNTECKKQETASIWSWMKQAESKNTAMPLIVFTRNRSEVYACLKLNDLVKLMAERAARDDATWRASTVVERLLSEAWFDYNDQDQELLQKVLTGALQQRPDLTSQLFGTSIVEDEFYDSHAIEPYLLPITEEE